LIGVLAFALLPVLASLAAGEELKPGASPASVVMIDGCSGVCVHPAGVILTAKHCQHNNRETIEFPDGRRVMAHKVYESDQTDGPVAFLADSGEGALPFPPIGAEAPEVGAKVYSWGYPAGMQPDLMHELAPPFLIRSSYVKSGPGPRQLEFDSSPGYSADPSDSIHSGGDE
jgi:hypothetical protein